MKGLRILLGGCGAALAICAAALPAAQAQPPAGPVTPPARADVALSGKVLAARSVTSHAACLSECRGTPGCTGYSFNPAAKGSCSLLAGALTDVAVKGAVSCRMPCEPELRKPGSQRLPATPDLPMRQPPAAAGIASTQSPSFGTGPVPYTPLPPCVPGRVSVVGSCSNAAVAATPAGTSTPPPAASTTVTLLPVNDNTIASSSVTAADQTTVFPVGYWFQGTSGIGMGCNHYLLAGNQTWQLTCARGLIKFNVASLAGKTIQSATLTLTTSASGVGSFKDPWYVAAGSSGWSGSTVTWINYVDQIYQASRSANQSAPTFVGQVFSLDQTATVRNWVSGLYANNGLAMGLVQERLLASQSLDAFAFYSSEDPGGRGPKLVVTYQ
jgi:hypothetical protein